MGNDFTEWNAIKQQIDSDNPKPPFFKECEIWWCSVGKNIGVEMNGKSNLYSRPVLVFKKLSLTVFIGIPLSTKIKQGSWFYVFNHKNKLITASLSQIRMFDYRRLSTRESEISYEAFTQIKKSTRRLLDL